MSRDSGRGMASPSSAGKPARSTNVARTGEIVRPRQPVTRGPVALAQTSSRPTRLASQPVRGGADLTLKSRGAIPAKTGDAGPKVDWKGTTAGTDGPDTTYTVNIYRKGDPNGGELHGVYGTKAQADKAVVDIRKWAADIEKTDAYYGVKNGYWEIGKVEIMRDGPIGGGPQKTTNPKQAAADLGWLSKRYEVGKGGAGTISTGKGDKGGISYGLYQLASKTGTAQRFADKYYASEFKDLKPGSKEFNSEWKKLASERPQGFQANQHQFIKETHYDPVVARVRKESGLDLNSRSAALQNAVWSTAVQHGKNGGARLVEKALANLQQEQPLVKPSDEDIITAIYDERGREDDKGNLVHFKGNSQKVQENVKSRFQREKQDALDALKMEKGKPAVVTPVVNTPLP